MPAGIPSHQGLILPLQRRFPRHIDALALCIGATMPDILDGLAYYYRGEMGQWLAHSLVGVLLGCVPVGVALSLLTRRALPRSWLARLDGSAASLERPPSSSLGLVAASMAIGALSHLAFDLISHGNFPTLLPWVEGRRVFPDWWYTRWATFDLPGYTHFYRKPYALEPHSLVWGALSVVGAVWFVQCLRAPRTEKTETTVTTPDVAASGSATGA